MVVYTINETFLIQSKKFKKSSNPSFLIKLKKNFSFKAFHCGVLCAIPTLGVNKVLHCKTWSCLEKIIRFLCNKELDHKKEVVLENLKAMGKKQLEKKLYSKLVKDYALPSISTLTRITAKIDKLNDFNVLKTVLLSLSPEKKMLCVILIDEFYIKSSLTYYDGKIFG